MTKARETYVIFNNHPAGQAVANAFEMTQRPAPERALQVPKPLLAAFPAPDQPQRANIDPPRQPRPQKSAVTAKSCPRSWTKPLQHGHGRAGGIVWPERYSGQ